MAGPLSKRTSELLAQKPEILITHKFDRRFSSYIISSQSERIGKTTNRRKRLWEALFGRRFVNMFTGLRLTLNRSLLRKNLIDIPTAGVACVLGKAPILLWRQ